jgi:amino acid adenylation domain-containing protein
MSTRFDDLVRSPLSPTQRDFLLDAATIPGASHHALASSLELGADIDVPRWQAAADAVCRAEPGLRMRLVTVDGETWQAVDPDARLATVVVRPEADGPGLDAWVSARLAARPDIPADPSFVHALVREPSGVWHAVLMGPHIFIDGQGFRRFFERTSAAYLGERDATAPSAQALFDAVERAAAGVDDAETLAFWRDRLAGVSPLAFRTRTERQGTHVDESLLLSREASAAVEECCRARRIHASDFFAAVYAIVLERLREAGTPWVLHTIRSTRRPDERDLMGCFYRAIPTLWGASALTLATPIASVLAWPRQDRDECGGRSRISMLALQESLPRGGARAIFNYYNFNDVRALGGVRQMRGHFFHRPDEVHLVVTRRPDGFELRGKFHTSTFADRRLLPRLAAVAAQVAGGARTVADCDWLLPDERPSAPSAPLDVRATVEEEFSRQARATPDATAATCGADRLSYRDLDAAATRVAERLMAHGAGPGTLVGVHVDRSLAQIAAILGVLKAGAAYVPVDPDYPDERVRYIVEDSGMPVLVGRPPAGPPVAGLRLIPLDDLHADLAGDPPAPIAPRASLDDLAYVIYTSGSTGRPKGTLVTRRNVASLLAASAAVYEFGPADVWTVLHSCAFDFSVWEMFAPLVTGGRLVVVPSGVTRSPTDLAALVDREGVTVLNQTPSAFYHLAAVPGLEGRSLRYVIFGGEGLDPRRLAGWFERFGDRSPRLVNMYGITETTVHVTHRRITRADVTGDGSPIGRPLPGWEVSLVDREGRLVPRGCSGEILVGGAGVARGYLNREALTRERFVDDPSDPGAGRRLYRSGDLAREDDDGEFEFLGRIDHQVKIRGYRVELGEVAAVLAEHPAVREAVVLAHQGPEGAFLVGYGIPRGEAVFDEADVLRFLRGRLPAYMTCARVVAVGHFPLTAHGKLDRAALPVPGDRPPEAAAFVAPRTESEALVASLFAEVTGAAAVGAEDDFFALGGHSLAAMRVAARLQDVFGVPAGAGLLFERPTVAQAAAWVDGQRGAAAAVDRPVFGREPHRGALPLTFAQERVFLLQRLVPHMTAYNFEASIRFTGRLDRAALEAALAQVVERHEAFRTTFHDEGGRVFQRVHERGVVSIEDVDLTAAPAEEAEARVEAVRRETVARTFDPARLPLAAWRLVRLSDREHVLLHREHHLVHDGWSFVVFLRDLLELYRAHVERRPPRLPTAVAVGDYAAAHRRWLEGPVGARQRQYWEAQLAGVPARVDLPADRVRPAVFSYRGDQLRFDLPPDLLRELRATATREGLTLYMLLLGAFSLVVSRLAGSDDLTIAAGVAARRWEEIENTIGMLLNNVVFRLRPRGDRTVRDYLHAVREQVLGALANQDLPFDEIVSAAGVPRSPSETPLGSIFFSSYEGPLPDRRLPDLTVDVLPGLALGSAKFDWNLVVIAQPAQDGQAERVTVLWEYATDLFDRATVERARSQFLTAARTLAGDLARPLAEVSIVDEAERRFLLGAAEGADPTYPRDARIDELFAARVAERPDAVAVRGREETLTYGELARRADAVAAGLRALGAGAEEPVAFLLPRGVEAIVTMLGILKAGGAYLPLSPKDPPARWATLVAGAGARLVVVADEAGVERLDGVAARVASYGALVETSVAAAWPAVEGADRLAAILFTSGSTGQPKGVEVLHRGIVRLLFGAGYASLGPGERFLHLAPLSFDASTLEIWGALLHGGEVAIFPDDLPSAASLGDAIRRHGVTTMWLNASLFNAVVDEDVTVLAPLRQLLIGGEALSIPHVERALQALPDTAVVNGYGPTENTTFSCCHPIPRDLDPRAHSIPIGRPIAHSRARLLDATLRLAPAGAIGEIYVGGDGLARGYRNRPDETRAAFLDDPFGPPGARLYRTGDLGRVRPDGTIEFRGRRDAQVKIRGHRIEPGEVEAALCRLDGVAQASVQVLDRGGRAPSLVAFAVPTPGTALEEGGLLRALARELPPYLVPSRVVVRDTLPLTAHGKVDAAALARAVPAAAPAARPWAMPMTALEGVVADVFAEVLDLSRVEPDSDFFAAGGHSLLVVRVLARLEQAIGERLEPAALLQAPTPRQLAREIEQRLAANARSGGRTGSMIRISSGARPLFFVPGGEGGDVSLGVYARFALHLPDHTFYGLRLASEDRTLDRRGMDVRTMAASCLEEILAVAPGEPFDLVGGCIGGIVAYEMARQLEAQGRPPRRLVLIDTIHPSSAQWLRYQARRWSAGVRRWTIRGLRASGIGQSKGVRIYHAVSRRLPYDELEAHPLAPPAWYRFGDRIVGHRLKPLRMPVVLLATQDLVRTGSAARWQATLGDRLTLHALPGTHWSYVRSELSESGAILRDVLARET